jgi:hypothetical protein
MISAATTKIFFISKFLVTAPGKKFEYNGIKRLHPALHPKAQMINKKLAGLLAYPAFKRPSHTCLAGTVAKLFKSFALGGPGSQLRG